MEREQRSHHSKKEFTAVNKKVLVGRKFHSSGFSTSLVDFQPFKSSSNYKSFDGAFGDCCC